MSNQITYDDKVDLNVASDIANINKVTAADMNEIKQVVNSIDTETSTNITDILQAINNPIYTTTKGTDLTINNTRVGKMKFEYFGNTEQETTTGKNKFDDSQISATQVYQCSVSTSDEITTISSTATSGVAFARFLPTMTLTPNTQYTLSFDVTGDYDHSRIYDVTGSSYIDLTTTTTSGRASGTFTTSANSSFQLMIYVVINKSCTISKIQVAQGTNSTYEPYTGGIASPNPDYPQEVKTVTGENTIDIVSKNQIGPLSDFVANNSSLQVTTTSASITVTHTTTQAWIGIYKELDNLIPNSIMILSVKGVTTTTTGYSMTVRNSGGQVVQEVIRQASGSRASFSFTVPSDGKIIIRLYAGYGDVQIGDTATYSELQLENGTTVTPYEPYQSQSYELNLGANVVDCSAFNTTTSSGITVTPYWGESGLLFLKSTGTFTATSYFNIANNIKFQPNTKYTINKSNYSGAQYRLREYDANNTQLSETFCGLTDVTITSNANVHHAVLQIVFYTTLNSFFYPQITKGTTAKKYQPYFTPIELCKIGDYQDYIYDNGGKWFKHSEISKAVLDGTHSGSRATTTGGYYRFNVNIGTNIFNTSNSSLIAPIYSDKFKPISREQSYAEVQGIAPTDTSFYYKSLIIYCEATKNMTYEEFQTWLSSNNVTVYYILATPIEEEITEPTLINQLNAIKFGAESYYGQTNIIITSEELQPTLKVETLDKIGG